MDKTPVLIIGGGVAGLAAAVDLARRGIPSLVAEKEAHPGGQAKGFCCKAVDACACCGACRLGDLLAEAGARPEISILTHALPVAAQPSGSGWRLELKPQPAGPPCLDDLGSALTEPLTLEAAAVILAVGHTPFDARKKSRFGYGRIPGVITAEELEAMLRSDTLVTASGQAPDSVAFIQCVGSRDKSLGNLYCSRVCCGYALRMARLAKGIRPEARVAFFHMDTQGYGRAWEAELPTLKSQIDFVRAMPGEVTTGDAGPVVSYYGPDGRPVKEPFDLVVLSVGLTPPASAKPLSEMFGIERTADGFLGREDSQVASGTPGVYVAGAARGPRSLVESIDHGGLAAAAAMAHLAGEAREAVHG